MHVLLVPSWYATPEDLVYGSFFREQAHALRRAGFRVGVIWPQLRSIRKWKPSAFRNSSGIRHWDDDGVQTLLRPGWGWFSKIPRLHSAVWLARGEKLCDAYVERYGCPDVLHAHSTFYGGVLAERVSRKHSIPYVVTEHSSVFARNLVRPWQHQLATSALRRAAVRMVVSPELGKLLDKHFGSETGPLEWVPNMVDPMFRPAVGRQKGASARIRLLNVGGLTVHKGHATLLRALRQAIDNGCDIELRIAGSGPERQAIELQVRALKLEGRVTLLGRIGRTAVLGEMQACDALVVSSYCETFGVVLIEAMACGKPVVATACGGPECVVDESSGVLVPPGDECALAEAFLGLQSNRQRFDSDAIRRNCLSRFGEQALVERLSNVYTTAVSCGDRVQQATRVAA